MTSHLLQRLDQIGESLAAEPTALALLGLGSAGQETERMDEFSDLDFFVVVDKGSQGRYTESLDWLSRVRPIDYSFRNTPDGYKLLFNDGIFCEFAVFEPDGLARVVYTPPRIVWMAEELEPSSVSPSLALPEPPRNSIDHLVGEVLTNLYVGLLREHRGERMAAFRMIQGHAIDRIMELAAHLENTKPVQRDPFGNERRFESRYPGMGQALPRLAQGYERNRESAAAILNLVEQHVTVNNSLKHEITRLIDDTPKPKT